MAATAKRQAPAVEHECKEHHDWPLCGCDPVADRVVAALLDQGWRPPVDFIVPGTKVGNGYLERAKQAVLSLYERGPGRGTGAWVQAWGSGVCDAADAIEALKSASGDPQLPEDLPSRFRAVWNDGFREYTQEQLAWVFFQKGAEATAK